MPYGIEDDPRNIPQMLANLNSNMPIKRRTLMDYIENGGNTYITKGGETCTFDRSAVEYLEGICNDQEKLTLKLPILISTDVSSDIGGWKVEGKTEVAVVSRMLNRAVHGTDYMQIYYADIAELKRKIPDLYFIVFSP